MRNGGNITKTDNNYIYYFGPASLLMQKNKEDNPVERDNEGDGEHFEEEILQE